MYWQYQCFIINLLSNNHTIQIIKLFGFQQKTFCFLTFSFSLFILIFFYLFFYKMEHLIMHGLAFMEFKEQIDVYIVIYVILTSFTVVKIVRWYCLFIYAFVCFFFGFVLFCFLSIDLVNENIFILHSNH